MIFRDKQNGGRLLNIRRDDFINDRKYFQEIIRIAREGTGGGMEHRHRGLHAHLTILSIV